MKKKSQKQEKSTNGSETPISTLAIAGSLIILNHYLSSLEPTIINLPEFNRELQNLFNRAKSRNKELFTELIQTFSDQEHYSTELFKIPTLKTIIALDQIPSLPFLKRPVDEKESLQNINSILSDIALNDGKKIIEWVKRLGKEFESLVAKNAVSLSIQMDILNKLNEYFEGMKYFALLFIGLFDILEGYSPFLKEEYKWAKTAQIFKNLVEKPKDKQYPTKKSTEKSKDGMNLNSESTATNRNDRKKLYEYCEEHGEFPEIRKFIYLLFDRIRKARNARAHSSNIEKAIQDNEGGIQEEILYFTSIGHHLFFYPITILLNLMKYLNV